MTTWWQDRMKRVNARLVGRFNHDVILHFEGEDKPILGIFDNPFSLREGHDGKVADTQTSVYIKDEDAVGVKMRSIVTIVDRKWAVISPPEPDGTGLTKLLLSKYDGKQQAVTNIRY
ncbi:MAG: hypothetical protein ACK5NC_11620 [Vibrio sp.]